MISSILVMSDHHLCYYWQVYVHDDEVTVGDLRVEVVECTRLFVMEGATSTYCTLSIGELTVGSRALHVQ